MSTQIFVDDNDPAIEYGEGWTLDTFDAANGTNLQVFPHYGTLHVPSEKFASASFSYPFNGTSISAWFALNTSSATIHTCLIDDRTKGMVVRVLSMLVCQTQSSLPEGVHALFVDVEPSNINSISLDYITYTPSGGDISGGDSFYDAGDPSITVSNVAFTHGATLHLDFFGYSLGLYGDFSVDNSSIPSEPSGALYAIDDQASVNFTIQNPSSAANSPVGSELVLQTPAYSLGQHHFRFTFLGTNETVPFQLDHIVVQNSTSGVDLEPFPSNVSSTSQAPFSPSPSSSSKQTPFSLSPSSSSKQTPTSPSPESDSHNALHIGIAIGVVAGVVTILALILGMFLYRRRRKSIQSDESGDSSLTAHPLMLPRILRIEPAKRRRGQVQLPGRGRYKPGQRPNSVPVNQPAQRVVMHIDSEDQPDEPDIQTEILELPPAYRSARHTPTSSYSSQVRPAIPPDATVTIQGKPET